MDYIPAKHLLHRSKSTSWFGTDHTMNLYRGCCHGCLYCDSRSACYQNPDFDRVKAKADALRLLRDDLARKAKPAFITNEVQQLHKIPHAAVHSKWYILMRMKIVTMQEEN